MITIRIFHLFDCDDNILILVCEVEAVKRELEEARNDVESKDQQLQLAQKQVMQDLHSCSTSIFADIN